MTDRPGYWHRLNAAAAELASIPGVSHQPATERADR